MSPLSLLLLLLCAVVTVNTFKLLAATPTDIIEEEAIQPWEDGDGEMVRVKYLHSMCQQISYKCSLLYIYSLFAT